MKKKQLTLLALLLALVVSSCSSYKQVPYLQFSEHYDPSQVETPLYDARILPKDLLTIVVSTTDPESAIPFNLVVPSNIGNQQSRNITTQPAMQQYLVDNEGKVEFPVLGTLHIGGMTKSEAEQLIISRLRPYLKETPIVTVRMTNYKISVMGEVARPGTFTISNEKVNLFEALAMAGDLTIYGERHNMKLVREDSMGQRTIVPIDLTRADVISSPYFYLQQNDVLYITPNKTKAQNSDIGSSTSLWFSATSILVSIAGLIVTVLR